MSWRQRIAIVVLFVLAAVPVAKTICAVACTHGASSAAAHHEAGRNCEEMAPPSAASQIDAGVPANCGTHDSDREQVATSASERVGLTIASVAVATVVNTELAAPVAATSISTYTAPPGTDPPTTIPLVLRV